MANETQLIAERTAEEAAALEKMRRAVAEAVALEFFNRLRAGLDELTYRRVIAVLAHEDKGR